MNQDVTADATWEISKATAELGDTEISITATYNNVKSEAFVVNVTVSSGTVLTEQEIYKLDGTTTATGNAYATASNVTQNGIGWAVTANTEQSPWRFGGKSITGVDRTAETKSALSSDDVTKVIVNTADATITVNSISLRVGTSQGASDIDEITLTTNLANASLEFARPTGHNWSGRYFTIVFNVTNSTTSNKFIQLSSAQFFAMK